jgi:hypothetical protein
MTKIMNFKPPGADVMILKSIFAKKLDQNIGFKKNAIFSPKIGENRNKIVIIASTPVRCRLYHCLYITKRKLPG